MKTTRNVLSWLLICCLVLGSAVPAFGAADVSAAVEERRLELERRYGIAIAYDLDEAGAPCIGTGSLSNLNKAFQPVTETVVRQVSAYYEKTIGTKLQIAFRYNPYNALDDNVSILASFNREQALIEVYMPSKSKGTFASGDNPVTILHEFAHAYYFMFVQQYGEEKMEREWVKLNDGVKYNEGFLAYAYNKVTFMSSYGATSLKEDFAELFSNAFVRYREGQGFQHRLLNGEKLTALGKKVGFIADMLPLYLTGTEAAVANLNRIYKTPIVLYYQDVKLYNEYLDYVGCSPPRYVLNGVLGLNKLEGESSKWVSDAGAWYVNTKDGKHYFVFPGGYAMPIPAAIQTDQ